MNTDCGISHMGRAVLCAIAALLLAPNSHAADGDLLEVLQPSNAALAEQRDAEGNYYNANLLSGTLDVDPGPGVHELTQHNTLESFYDCYVRKLDPLGQFEWALHLPSAYVASIALDDAGNVYIAGRVTETLILDDAGTPVEILVEPHTSVGVAIKLDANGTLVWARRFGSPQNYPQSDADLTWIAASPTGNILVFGAFFTRVDVDPGPEELELNYEDGEGFLATLDPDGNLLDVKQNQRGDVNWLMLDDGTLYSYGVWIGDTDVEPGPGVVMVPSERGYFSKFNAEGEHLWTKILEGNYRTACTSLSPNPDGSIAIAGSFSGMADLDPGTGEALFSTGSSEVNGFVAKYDGDGNYVWGNEFVSNSAPFLGSVARYVCTGESGAVYTIGAFYNSMTFVDEARQFTIKSAGEADIFIAKHMADGQFQWVKRIGNSLEDDLFDSAIVPGKGLYLWGRWGTNNSEPLDVDPGPTEALLDKQNGSNYRLLFETSDVPPVATRHSADVDDDQVLSLSELLRIIQLYNFGSYHCAESVDPTEDGFLPGPGATGCTPHASDFNPQDWTITLSELLRAVQFYNTGAYRACPDFESEDGFCPDTP